MVQEMVGHPRSLYFTRIGPDRSPHMFVGKKTFFGTFVFLFLVHISVGPEAFLSSFDDD